MAIDADRDFLETEREAARRIVAPEREIRDTPVPTVTPTQLRHMLDQGQPVTVLDVRSRQAYTDAQASIPGSLRIAPPGGRDPGGGRRAENVRPRGLLQ